MSEAAAAPLDPNESRAGVAIAVTTVCLVVSLTAVVLRTYARAVLIRQFGYDDWVAILAVLFAIGSGLMIATNTLYGQGRHVQTVDPALLPKYFRTFYISIVLYNASLTSTKFTFLLQYYRIMGTGQMRKVIIVAFVFVGAWSISQLLVATFNCSPIPKFWLPETPGTCIPNLPFWYINAAGNIVTDVTVFVLPLPALTRLNLRRTQKFGLIGVFSLGFFTCAISVIRIQYLKLSDDVTWDNITSACWSIGEICSGITCACLPTLRPLLSGWFPGMRSQTGGPSDNNYYKRSSGRDISHASRLKSTDENGSSRGIIYPEDVELQSDDRSDKQIRVTVDRQNEAAGGAASNSQQYTRMDRLKLGLKPTVRTEIKVGSPSPQASWQSSERGIEVKRDFTMTTDR